MNKRPLEELLGIAFMDDKGKFQRTPPRPRIKSLDKIPWPSWEESPLENYLTSGFGYNSVRGRNMPMIASRGCPYQCTFCSNPAMWTTQWNARDPHDVVKEIKFYIDNYGINHVEFYDLTTIIRKDWILEFTRSLVNEKLELTWALPSGTRSEALDREVLHLLKQSGCQRMTYAMESGSRSTLKRIKKKIKLPKMLQSMRAAIKEGLDIRSNIVFGFPAQTKREALETYGALLKLAWIGASDVAVYPFIPYPGSELFRQLKKEGRVPTDTQAYEDFLTRGVLNELSRATSWDEYMTDRQLHLLIVGGVLWFYCWQFIFRPQKMALMFWRVLRGRPFTTMEVILDGLIRNFLKGRKRNIKAFA